MSKDRKGELSTKKKQEYRLACGERDGWKCQMCGVNLVPESVHVGDPSYYVESSWMGLKGYSVKPGYERATLDHIVPLSIQNILDISNFRLLCHNCNAKKGNRV